MDKYAIINAPVLFVMPLVPMRNKNGALNTEACLQCAEETTAYYLIHQIPHIGFEDGTHACYRCINDEATRFSSASTIYTGILRNHLQPSEFNALYFLAEGVSYVTRMIPPQFRILRAIIALAKRIGVNRAEVMQRMLRSQSVERLIPFEVAGGMLNNLHTKKQRRD